MKKSRFIPALALCLLLCGCSGREAVAQTQAPAAPPSAAVFETVEISRPDVSGAFSNRDIEGGYDESAAVRISLTGDSAACDDSAVSIAGSTVTIGGEGVYLLSGRLEGSIVIDAADTDKVQLVLDGAQISSPTGAAIQVIQAGKVFITLAQGTENALSNSDGFEGAADKVDAAVFSRDDLTINGEGSLTVSGGEIRIAGADYGDSSIIDYETLGSAIYGSGGFGFGGFGGFGGGHHGMGGAPGSAPGMGSVPGSAPGMDGGRDMPPDMGSRPGEMPLN